MPRWASRITLEITNVRVERVREISEADAKAEGINISSGDAFPYGSTTSENGGPWCNTAVLAFMGLWDSINVKRGYGWDVNPFVWVIKFKRIEP
jgi:hypothetical protein